MSSNFVRKNNQIKAKRVRLIVNDNNLGVMSKQDALIQAKKVGLDLIEVSPNAKPPVCKILDHGKFLYEQNKNKSKSKDPKTHEVRFGVNIGDHDFEVKTKSIDKFLKNSNKVKINIFFKGRQNAHRELGFELAKKITNMYGEEYKVTTPKLTGKKIIFFIE